ncbi:MAG: hypothetical protein IJV15_09210 [Lachnospiraceae bacterium]|nr:hypothetical protein [Lachnospiraceae bacterium]
MDNLFKLKNHAIKKSSKYMIKYNLILEDDCITNIIQTVVNKGYKIIFGDFLYDDGYLLNGHSSNKNIIYLSSVWYSHLLLYRHNIDTITAFKITIGHEIAHRKFDDSFKKTIKLPLIKSIKYLSLLSNIKEVHHDFYGCQLFCDSSKQNLITSSKYKEKYNRKQTNKEDKSDISHPSWEQRIKYAKYGSFDRGLLNMIAEDTKVSITPEIEELFDRIMAFYGEIHLQ